MPQALASPTSSPTLPGLLPADSGTPGSWPPRGLGVCSSLHPQAPRASAPTSRPQRPLWTSNLSYGVCRGLRGGISCLFSLGTQPRWKPASVFICIVRASAPKDELQACEAGLVLAVCPAARVLSTGHYGPAGGVSRALGRSSTCLLAQSGLPPTPGGHPLREEQGALPMG